MLAMMWLAPKAHDRQSEDRAVEGGAGDGAQHPEPDVAAALVRHGHADEAAHGDEAVDGEVGDARLVAEQAAECRQQKGSGHPHGGGPHARVKQHFHGSFAPSFCRMNLKPTSALIVRMMMAMMISVTIWGTLVTAA